MNGYVCSGCGHAASQWFGRCPACGAWNAAVEPGATAEAEVTTLERIVQAPVRVPTGIDEFDRVLGGGLVPGAVVLVAGEPGMGKSTLALQMLDALAAAGRPCLLAAGEESIEQVALRGRRLGVDAGAVRAVASTSPAAICGAAARERARVVVVDSVQSLQDEALEQGAGSVVQVRSSATRLTKHAKETGCAVVLVGHVTKEGTVAGPKTLEHMVDAVVTLEGDRSGSLRVLRAVKNRFGSCEETGVFVMAARGLEPVPDPSALLLADRCAGIAGSVVFPSLAGSRPMLIEMQALAARSELANPRRVALGVDGRRLSLLLGVLHQRAGLAMVDADVFVSAAGGLSVPERASDLAICLAVASARTNTVVDGRAVAVGEVGLGGEVRRVPGIERRLAEAARHGFTTALVPRGTRAAHLDAIEVPDLASALRRVRGIARAA